jgi:hypothetical protein
VADKEHVTYESPTLHILGRVEELTLADCFFGKTVGDPDYVSWIPITNCSS